MWNRPLVFRTIAVVKSEISDEQPTRISVSMKMERLDYVVADLWDKGSRAYLTDSRRHT